MFRQRVADHYRSRGYTVHENVRLRGTSGAIHACDMVLQGELGNLIVAFEDAGGLEGPEIGAVHRTAQDVGAAAIVAAKTIPPGVRPFADRMGVVLLDESQLSGEAPVLRAPEAPLPEIDHPWPQQDKADEELVASEIDEVVNEWVADAPAPAPKPALWKHAREGEIDDAAAPAPEAEPQPQEPFAWLPNGQPVAPRSVPVKTTAPAPAPATAQNRMPARPLPSPRALPVQRWFTVMLVGVVLGVVGLWLIQRFS